MYLYVVFIVCIITEDLYNLRVEKHMSYSLDLFCFFFLSFFYFFFLVLVLVLVLVFGLCCCVVHMLLCYMLHKRLDRPAQTHATKHPYP